MTNADCTSALNAPKCDAVKKVCVKCGSDADCSGQHCDTMQNGGAGACVDCTMDSHCMSGSLCNAGKCAPGCKSDANCGTGKKCLNGTVCVTCITGADCMMGQSCEPNSHSCVACLQNTDCPSGNVCHQNMCVPGCDANQHCANGKACSLSSGTCVDCVSDADCKTAQNPRCDATMNKCVACLQGSDNCPAGQYCAGTTCYPGCRSNTDCQVGNPSPASQGKASCLVAKNTCVACLSDADCSAQNICGMDHTCTMGCHSDAQCLSGSSCCGGSSGVLGQCQAINTPANCGICGNACGSGQGCCSGTCLAFNSGFNCGGCGIVCGPGTTCCGGSSQVCGNLLTDAKNCGACGNACGAGQICCAGQCRNPNTPGNCVDCTKTCNTVDVTGQGFKQTNTTLSNLVLDTSSNLAINNQSGSQNAAQSTYVYVAMHDTNNINVLDAATGANLGSYPSGGHNPSRGAMAWDNTMWTAHRCQDGTSTSDPTCSNVTQMDSTGKILCTVGRAADGGPMPFVRGLAIDAKGFVWVSTWDDGRIHKIDPLGCKTILDISLLQANGSRAYGLAIDSNGIMWTSTIGTGPFTAIDTNTGQIKTSVAISSVQGGGTAQTYGIVIDRKNNVYLGNWQSNIGCSGGIFRIDGANQTLKYIPGQSGACTRGMAIDSDGNIWAAEWSGGSPTWYAKFNGDGTGTFINRFRHDDVTAGVGLACDAFGNCWGSSGNYAGAGQHVVRFSKDTGLTNATSALTGSNAYNYSDWIGYSLRSVTSPTGHIGIWTAQFDGQRPAVTWDTITYKANIPMGAALSIRARAAGSPGQLLNQQWCGPFYTSPIDLTTCNFGQKQWLGVEMQLITNNNATPPTVSDFTVSYQY